MQEVVVAVVAAVDLAVVQDKGEVSELVVEQEAAWVEGQEEVEEAEEVVE